MAKRASILALMLGIWAWSGTPAWSQEGERPRLDAIWDAYQALDYARAQALAETALATYEAPQDLSQIHVVLGLIAFSQNDQQAATRQFTDALLLDPAAALDARLVSPKALDLFDEIRARLAQATPEAARVADASPRYVLVPDRRAEAALRSMVLPGWGQLYKGQRTKGRVLLGAWGVAVASTVSTHVLRQQSRDTYLDARTPGEIRERYDTFNRWHKARNVLVLGTAVIWAYSYLDALVAGGQPLQHRSLHIAPTVSARQMHIVVRVRL